jgi:hypothetical protein
MEVAGVVLGAVPLATLLLKMGRALQQAVKKMRHACAELQALADETGFVAYLYHEFEKSCAPDVRKDALISSPAKRLERWTRSALRSFEKLLQKVKALVRDSENSLLQTWVAHIRWLLKESAVKALRASLSVARESIMCITNIRAVEHLRQILKLLETARAEGKLQQIEIQLGTTWKKTLDNL